MVLGHRRALLAASAYANQADVTVMMIEDSSTIPSTMTELNTSISNSTLLVSTCQELRSGHFHNNHPDPSAILH